MELEENPRLRKGSTTITIHERRGLYIVDLYRQAADTAASIFTIIGAEDGPRSYDDEDNESYEEHDEWFDDGSGDDDGESREDTAAAIVSHAETETQREPDWWTTTADSRRRRRTPRTCGRRGAGCKITRFPLMRRRTSRAPRHVARSFGG